MGIDWVPMTPKAEASLEEIAERAREQATAFQSNSEWVYDDFLILAPEPDENAFENYRTACNSLISLLDIDFNDSWRVNVIGGNSIFPAEWRLTAFRTILPDELPTQLGQWRSYINAIRLGGFPPYLLEWYLYKGSQRTFETWQYLRTTTEDTLSEKHPRLAKPKIRAALPQMLPMAEEVLQAPKPSAFPMPLWSESDTIQTLADIEHDPRYVLFHQERKALLNLILTWNRVAPYGMRVFPGAVEDHESFSEFATSANDEWLHEFFNWVEKWCAAKKGLYLWY